MSVVSLSVVVGCVAIDTTQQKTENRSSDAPPTIFDYTNSTKDRELNNL
ncbi:MAG: hypothetical protein JGK01_03420 [Microcoleus sp. PH2017_03_ELD_O_A]|nr:hypothetical protein [Microcoleus sp. PH2017_03_ELD_O_A]MCC3566322.1 hypothetical protein [Microcoleus sp. PH2017_31_RDM_U_A]